MRKILLLMIIAIGLQACSQKLNITALENTKWTLSEWPGRSMPVTAQATLNFDKDQKINGKSFCNSYGGNSVFTAGSAKFDQIFSTKMFCSELSEAENNYQADLVTVNTLKMSGAKLQLLQDEKVVMVFVKSE